LTNRNYRVSINLTAEKHELGYKIVDAITEKTLARDNTGATTREHEGIALETLELFRFKHGHLDEKSTVKRTIYCFTR